MYKKVLILLLLWMVSVTLGHLGKCDQTPPQANVLTPSEDKGIFKFYIETKETQNLYLPDQTYVLILTTTDEMRPFRWFMITAEDPDVDNSISKFDHREVDVGILKTLDTDRQSRYSERCYSSVENADNSDKNRVEIHWVSPKQSNTIQKVRLRAMVAENEEVWYASDNLTIILEKNDNRPIDSPPYLPSETCNLCSEARYEVIFKGSWSRVTHPLHYPSKPDDNGFSHMVGASHAYEYTLWQQGVGASKGLQKLAEDGDISIIEREIIEAMSLEGGTRTLIRGKRRHHPHMSEPSHSLFRVDRIHHLFSIAVGMRPSPDWFLGTSKFELCTELGWLENSSIPLYPWDAGTMDGISYESPKTMTQPVDNVERVAVGSFDRESPFYQMNLNDLKPFAHLQVRRLDVYPLLEEDCGSSPQSAEPQTEETEAKNIEETPSVAEEEAAEEPKVAESMQLIGSMDRGCDIGEWGAWSPCVPSDGTCGIGVQIRTRYKEDKNVYYQSYKVVDNLKVRPLNTDSCQTNKHELTQTQRCFVDCN